MKKLVLAFTLAFASSLTFSQAAPIRGEVSAGVYENIKTDGNGKMQVSASITPAPGSTFAATAPTVTNASAQLLAANSSRKFLSIQNNDTTGILYVNFGAVSTAAAFKIAAGATLILDAAVPTTTITAIGSIASNANVVLVEGQ